MGTEIRPAPNDPTPPRHTRSFEGLCPNEGIDTIIGIRDNGKLWCTSCGAAIPVGYHDEKRVPLPPENDKERTKNEERFDPNYRNTDR
jgi:hypothetical protein